MVASVAARSFNSGYSFDGGGNSAAQWPRSMVNTGICVCPQVLRENPGLKKLRLAGYVSFKG